MSGGGKSSALSLRGIAAFTTWAPVGATRGEIRRATPQCSIFRIG